MYRLQASSRESRPPRTAATISALRRMLQRIFVSGSGKSAIVSGLPSGPMTYLERCTWVFSMSSFHFTAGNPGLALRRAPVSTKDNLVLNLAHCRVALKILKSLTDQPASSRGKCKRAFIRDKEQLFGGIWLQACGASMLRFFSCTLLVARTTSPGELR